MAPDKVALQDLSAEQEADALLAEEDARERASKGIATSDNDAFKDGLEELERSESLPTPVQAVNQIVPIGALFSASLIFSNLAYLTLSVSFIQMLKAFTSVAVLTMSVLMGLDQFNKRTATTVIGISVGVAIASYGEINLPRAHLVVVVIVVVVISVLGGFIFQCFGILFEATRLVAIQKLLQGLRMDPLVSLYYYAPVCAALNALLIPIFEGWAPFDSVLERVGFFTLFINCNVALLLNISVVFLIGCASSLVLTLSGVLKDILLVLGAVLLFGATVTWTQIIGYGIALAGLVVFKTPQDVMAGYIASFKAAVGLR
ncbi:hypothetical protein OIO90_005479 [Microbotryomycetes sp. JL221]|nr:hypothetical protein OIO90_005479 [Microbotryomycetes sp. JL221]